MTREDFNAYQRKWRKENPDKVRQYQMNYYDKKLKAMRKAKREARKAEG